VYSSSSSPTPFIPVFDTMLRQTLSFARGLPRLAPAFSRSLPRATQAMRAAAALPRVFSSSSFVQSRSDFSAEAQPDMFCFQCEQTENTKGCTAVGVCGKTPETAALQDLLVFNLKGLGEMIKAARGSVDQAKLNEMSRYAMLALFSTMTNVNFNSDDMITYLKQCAEYKQELAAHVTPSSAQASWTMPEKVDPTMLVLEGKSIGVLTRADTLAEEVLGLQELVTYGLKGLCAYAHHASVMGKESQEVLDFVADSLAFLTTPEAQDINSLLATTLDVGKHNITAMALLDEGHTETYGHPEPTEVRTTPVSGKCILVSGHDIHDLEKVLQATEGKGINVYTHGELLPANSYPHLKKYSHLVGNFGGAWQNQKVDFAKFPGAILLTSNCLVEPKKRYANRIFTTGPVGFEGVPHIENDFTPLVEAAMKEAGFASTAEDKKPLTIGFGRNTVAAALPTILDTVKAGALRHIFLIGGCDGSEGERSYFTDLAKESPSDSIILTLGCGKYRVNNLDLGNIGPFPRVLDMGQCNDAYSAVQVATALSSALGVGLNDLPLTLALSWFEQKAVAVLLSLLHLNVKNIYIGPHLPAFVRPQALGILVEKFGLRPVNTASPSSDLKEMLQPKA